MEKNTVFANRYQHAWEEDFLDEMLISKEKMWKKGDFFMKIYCKTLVIRKNMSKNTPIPMKTQSFLQSFKGFSSLFSVFKLKNMKNAKW